MSEMPPGYDRWKLRSPDDERYYDEDYEAEDECDHVDYETSVEGPQCGRCWWPTSEEIETERRLQREHDEWERRQARREFWRRLTYPIRWPIYRMLDRIWPRKACSVLTDDEVPF